MPDTEPTRPEAPQVQDKRFKIPGLLPKNAQGRILAGIALLMVVIIALSGKNPPKERRAPPQESGTATVDPNQTRIQEYRVRIEEQARKLAAEEAELAQTKQVLGLPTQRSAGAGAAYMGAPYSPYARDMAGSAPELERDKREARSPFASNIALSYRPAPGSSVESPAPGRSSDEPIFGAAEAESGHTASLASHLPAGSRITSQDPKVNGLQRAEGKDYRLFEGTVIETVLTNRLDSSFSGPVNCMVTTNVYSHDRQHLLIPQGARVLGEVRKLEAMGEQRLAVTFHRLIMPDGYSISLDKFQGLSQIGETGLQDQVNHHYLQIFGVSLAIGAIAGLAQANTQSGLETSAADAYRQGVASSLSQSSLRILDRYLNVLPTFTIREGHRVKIYLAQDLVMPAYEGHQMPADL